MDKKYTSKSLRLDELVLDKENPRFAELYNGSDKEADIIEYLLYTESADEVAEAIASAEEFYDDRPLWVFKDNENYIVKDGNRRCAAAKALQLPNKYGLEIPKFEINELPVLEYHQLSDLETRIRIEHNSNLFKKWGRIAKALEIYRLFSSGTSLDALTEIDSSPKDFIKIATFYHEAVKIKGEEFKKLVRDGRGKTGGKTIVFERLFKSRSACGYQFKRDTSEMVIKDHELFTSYVNAIVSYLIDNPDTSSREVDKMKPDGLLSKLKPYGFPPERPDLFGNNSTPTSPDSANETTNTEDVSINQSGGSGAMATDDSTGESSAHSSTIGIPVPPASDGSSTGASTTSSTRHSVKNKPSLKRKQIPAGLKRLIEECYKLDEHNFPNAKTALTRVTLECTLKYVVENTNKANGNPIKTSNHFDSAFKDRHGNQLQYTNFDTLKSKFSELIKNVGIRKAFEDFDLQNPHQIIHNYHVEAVPANARALCDNLTALLEFMLQDATDLMSSLDSTKL